MAARPPLPFGLGRDPTCGRRCLSPDSPLPAPGNPLHDQVAQSLSQLFQTFFSTSLRYLGVSEVLDWVESSGTIDAWILTGLEQGRSPDDVGSKKNLEFGREAIKSVVRNALEAEDEAWATSLRETGFSSSVSMVYEGIVAQLKPSKSTPLPCLHTLLTPTGLSMLKSAPLKSAFPICPPRTPPSCSPLLASIRTLITSGALTGPGWKTPTVWRAAIRKAFAAYHTLLREIAEELVSAREFAQEYYIFLENISQPIQLLQLIADDFEVEFGVGATRGLLGVGEAGGDNLISIMDFCAAKKPSELLARVKQRVAEKQERERRQKEVEAKRAELKELDGQIRVLLLEYREKGALMAAGAKKDATAQEVTAAEDAKDEAAVLQRELETTLDKRDACKAQVEELQAREEADEKLRKRDRAEKERALAAVGVKVEGGRLKAAPVPAQGGGVKALPAATGQGDGGAEKENVPVKGFTVGSSKELLRELPPTDPFATNAPRAVSPAVGSAKGKARALNQPGKSRSSTRYAPPPPSDRYNRLRDFSPAPALPSSRPETPLSSRASSPAPSASSAPTTRRTSRKRAPPSTSSSTSPSQTRRAAPARSSGSRLRPASPAAGAGDESDYCEECCPACAAELARGRDMLEQTQRKRALRKKQLRREFGLGGGVGGGGKKQVEVEVEVRVEMDEEEEDEDEAMPPLQPIPSLLSAVANGAGAAPRGRSDSSSSADSMPPLEALPQAPPHPPPAAAKKKKQQQARPPPPLVAKQQQRSPAPPVLSSAPMSRESSGASDDSMPPLEALPTSAAPPPPQPVNRVQQQQQQQQRPTAASKAPKPSAPPMQRQDSYNSDDSMPPLEKLPSAAAPPPPAVKQKPQPTPAAPKSKSKALTAPPLRRRNSGDTDDSMPDLEPLPGMKGQQGGVHDDEADDPPEVALEAGDAPSHPLAETTNTSSSAAKKKKKKKKKTAAAKTASGGPSIPTSLPPPLDSLHPSSPPGFTPLSRYPPPKCCPPHRCTGVGPNYAVWAELDQLLYETCLAGFKYELIGALPSALVLVRDIMAKNYLLAGGRMTTDVGEPQEMDTYLALAEQRGLWHSVHYPAIQAWGQRVLAISLQKLVDVLRATLGDICICKMSQHLEILREARHRLSSCEQLDRQIPIDLPEMDHQQFMKWAHVQLREHKLAGHEWEGLSRQYIVQDFLLAFSDAFDAAMDRLVLRDPLLLAEDVSTLLEWCGGVRAFEAALRLGAKEREGIVVEFGTGIEILEGTEAGPVERRPLQAWGRLLELSAEARTLGAPFSRDLAEQEKQRGNTFFAAGEFEKAIVSFTTASIIHPLEPTYSSNAAAARMKLGTASQYSEAICDCTVALFYDSRNIKALYRRGMALALTGHWKAAFADLKYLERIAPDCQPAKEALSWANERYAALTAKKAVA
ncbi:hypothetical protein JCM6882_001672 [Rhodosporidiobolus microsporus]